MPGPFVPASGGGVVSAPAERVCDIAVIPGDGIGVEVIPEGLRVLERLAEQSDGRLRFRFESFPWGSQYYLQTGRMMDPDGLERLEPFDAIYFGAVGWPDVPDHISLWGLRLAICQGFDQYACIRPVRLLPGVPSPLRDATCERIIRYAFELARTRKRQKVTSVTKSNAQQFAMVLWDDAFDRVRADFPDVLTEQWLVDAMAARFVLRPETLEVVVGSNLFGDILSDLGSAIGGSLGIAASANLDPERRHPSMFEPVHGSAPDIAGQGIANPIAAIWTAALMLEHLGLEVEAARVMRAIEATTAAGVVTPDLGGTASTRAVGDAGGARVWDEHWGRRGGE